MKDLWLATHNEDKVKEFQVLLKNFPFKLKTPKDLPQAVNPPHETGSSFLENAQIKLSHFQKIKKGAFILAEDSGIEVQALGGHPGIHSARYLGEAISWNKRLTGLLQEVGHLKNSKNFSRQAQMVSVILLSSPGGAVIESRGVIEGALSFSITKGEGFGYDFVFIPKGESQTIAELSAAYKNKHSHRARACWTLFEKLKKQPCFKKIF